LRERERVSNGIVVDANVMSQFTQSLIREENTPARFLIESIEATIGFAIDKRGQIQQQWRNTCGHRLFGEWLIGGLKKGTVRMVDASLDLAHRKKLCIDKGFPNGGYELTYVAVAAKAPPHHIVTDDIDFWEPKYKKAEERTKTAAKECRSGTVCKYLSKKLGIRVGTVVQTIADFNFGTPAQGPPANGVR
jgi:hypothetical protein